MRYHIKGQTMYYVIKFHSTHYRAPRLRYNSRKVWSDKLENSAISHFFLFVQPLLIRDGPYINMIPLRCISTYYLKHFRV